jgi:hypothetical protein
VGHISARSDGGQQFVCFGGVGVEGFGVARHVAVSDEVAEVGHDPVLAGLDEPVVVELPEVGVEQVGLFGDHGEQRL